MDTSNGETTARKSYLTGTLIAAVGLSFIFFLSVIYVYWVTQPEPSAMLDVKAEAYYDQAEIVIETPGQPTLRKALQSEDETRNRFILNPGVATITVMREKEILFYREVEIKPGKSLMTLKAPETPETPETQNAN